MLGIDEDKRVFYEGPSNIGIAIWPTPFISIATPIRTDQDLHMIPAQSSMGNASLVFREDQFDPVTRIRRGRFTTEVMAPSPKHGQCRRIQHFPVTRAMWVREVSSKSRSFPFSITLQGRISRI
jgi:hypothetical protein